MEIKNVSPYKRNNLKIPPEIIKYVYYLSVLYKQAVHSGNEKKFLIKVDNVMALLSNEN
jgi:hypothetical protein